MSTPSGYPRAHDAGDTRNDVVELDRRSRSLKSQPAAAGSGTMNVQFDPVQLDQFWLVDRIIIWSTSSAGTQAYVYDDTPSPENLLGGTSTGNFDYDDTNSPYLVDAGKQLQVIWLGAADGAVGTCRIQYRLMAHPIG